MSSAVDELNVLLKMPRKSRRELTLSDKLAICDRSRSMTHKTLADLYDVVEKTIGEVVRSEKELRQRASEGVSLQRKRARPPQSPTLDASALEVIRACRQAGLTISGSTIRNIGLRLKNDILARQDLNENERAKLEKMEVTNKWVRSFVARNNFTSVLVHGAAGSVNSSTISTELTTVRPPPPSPPFPLAKNSKK